jgi:hypothetical protein
MARLLVALVALTFLFPAYESGVSKDRQMIRQGMLLVGLDRDDVIAEWGLPDRTESAVSGESLQVRWGIGGGGAYKGNRALDVWIYEKRGVTLVFDDDELIAWKTDKTREQLRSP